MAFVKQRNKTDCGVAALAMLCDVTYEDAYRAIPWRREGLLNGTDLDQLITGAAKFNYETTTKQLREGGAELGYETKSTPHNRLKRVEASEGWREEHGAYIDYNIWSFIPDNSLVKMPQMMGERGWHWVVWKDKKVYDPARGVFKPKKMEELFPLYLPSSYMQFIRREDDVRNDD